MTPSNRIMRAGVLAAATVTILAGAACSTSERPADQLVLAEAQPLGDYNPLLGYGNLGVSPIYEGLLAPRADSDTVLPDLVPALAAAPPQHLSGNTWRIPLQTGVQFSDGSTFDSADVVATYKAVTDPIVASDAAVQFAPLIDVAADGDHAVTVTMDSSANPQPYLLLGIVPSEKVENAPAAEWEINTDPTGTGPYQLESLRPDQAVMVARDDYRGPQPAVRRVVYIHAPDDNTRAQQVAAGEVDGAQLPPKLASTLDGRNNVTTVSVNSADWRSISLPAGNTFTADPQARLAMNVAVNRDALISDVLDGQATPAYTPIGPVYGDYYNGEVASALAHNLPRARQILDAAGWHTGADGVRSKDGHRAAFTVRYHAEDTTRRDLAVAVAEQLRALGVDIDYAGSSWDDIETHLDTDAVILAGGEMPYSVDQQTYTALHTRTADSSPYANPGNFTSPGLDTLLDQARATADGPTKTRLYQQIQESYAGEPSAVFLTFSRHTYGQRATSWQTPHPILEPHAHGVTWGSWWNLPGWQDAQ